MATSAVAGIVDAGGGLRVVVTADGFEDHVGKGERLFVVPDMLVDEPVPWNDIPDVIYRVQKHVAKALAPTDNCSECLACCRIFPIDAFECAWLKSQERNDKMIAALRPDRCGAIFTDDASDPLLFGIWGAPDKHAAAWMKEMERVGYKFRKAGP